MAVGMNGFEHGVTWEEFQRVAERPGGEAEDALVRAEKNVDYDFAGGGSDWQVTAVRARIAVNQADSWVVQAKQTDPLLEHEQGHFDITALGMREEANRTDTLVGTSENDLRSQYEEIREEINLSISQANQRYDTRTDHGSNEAAQRRWVASIRAAKRDADGTIDALPD